MKLRVDDDLCTGHGRCYALAPQLFEPDDDDGRGVVIGDGDVPAELLELAEKAVRNCPERAITLL